MERGTNISGAKKAYRQRNEGDFPALLKVTLVKETDLKYGENPNQQGAVYVVSWLESPGKVEGGLSRCVDILARLTNLRYARTDDLGKGGLSLTNQMDITRGMDCLKWFLVPAGVIMKHNIAAGFAKKMQSGQKLVDLFRLARDADRRSNMGGTAVFNRALDRVTAEAMYELKGESPFFVDVVAAPEYEEGVIDYIQGQSQNIRIATFAALDKIPKFQGDDTLGLLSFKEMPTGRIGVQDLYLTSIRSAEDLILDPMIIDAGGRHVIERDPDEREKDDLLTAWRLNISGARSNGIFVVRNGVSKAVGSGQVERVGSVEQAVVKGMQKAMDMEGIKYDPLMGIQGYERLRDNPFERACVSSDAFIPNVDSVDTLARVGATAIIQPFGSNADVKVIDAANRHKMAMPATLERCFGHW